jgi:hypothetical protein
MFNILNIINALHRISTSRSTGNNFFNYFLILPMMHGIFCYQAANALLAGRWQDISNPAAHDGCRPPSIQQGQTCAPTIGVNFKN